MLSLLFASCTSSDTGQEYAYFILFEDLFEKYIAGPVEKNREWLGYNHAYYIALDLANVKLEDTAPLIKLFQDFCDENGFILLLCNYKELIDKDLHWENLVYLYAFEDEKLNENILISGLHEYRSGVGIDYTAELINKSWEITKKANFKMGRYREW